MCGFVGGLFIKKVASAQLSEALELLRHRGPDHCEYHEEQLDGACLYLGHTRLSVIDLTPAAQQPFFSRCGRYVLIYNGEIYNYRELAEELATNGLAFDTHSDTEVLLSALILWGVKCLPKLIGMFSFVFYDRQEEKLLLARDAFGIKPLFFSFDEGGLIFSSEIRPLVALRRTQSEPDLQRAYDYLVHGDYDSCERSFVKGIFHLMPAHFFTFDLRKKIASTPEKWWAPDISTRKNISFEEAAEQLRSLFLDSIKWHLRSDVPIGVALSGGIDSSAVVSVVRHLQPDLPIKTFSYVASDPSISEEAWIDLINDTLDTTPYKVAADHSEMKSDLDKMLLAQGEPFGSTSIYAQYRVFKLARESGVVVTLDGQGADELLAGYSGYPGQRLMSLIETQSWLAACLYAARWAKFPGRSFSLAWQYFLRLKLPDWMYKVVRRVLGRDFEPEWLNIEYLRENKVQLRERRATLEKENSGVRVKEALGHALSKRGLPHLLRHGDRNSMAFSIESRVPFLTLPLAEFLLSLPENYLISDLGVTKNVFREAMRGIVPDAVLDRADKIGFATPEAEWLLGMTNVIEEWIHNAPTVPFLDKGELLREFQYVASGKKPFDGRVWRWVNYLRWYDLMGFE